MTLPTLILYALWLALTAWTMPLHWVYPLIVFALGAVILHNSVQGGPLRALVKWVQAQRKVDGRRAQQLTFAAGFLAVLACTPVVAVSSRQAEERRFEAQRLEAEADQRREAAARAEREAAEARRAAAQAEAERIKAAQEAAAAKAAEQRQAQQEADARRRDAEEADRQRQEDAQRAEQKRKDDAERAEQAQQEKDRQEQEAAQQEAIRRAEEGPYTQMQAEEMCRQAIAEKFSVPVRHVFQVGSIWENLNNGARNVRFGDGRLWFWRAAFRFGADDVPYDLLCRVHEDGQVEVVEQ
ncbi:hypothetical protein DAETH_10050 [Deinococcus aetherius]|uniref:TolA protein n=1 Tax=Deinococcus aetherius TaxID=200252 RepID=A0ABN6RH58_9DEIO|nr:hypothetical protein [Deinococcus aetherius]BDP41036.1 hypothetical protein DAETH_10050 [Deinococcus aetherius]